MKLFTPLENPVFNRWDPVRCLPHRKCGIKAAYFLTGFIKALICAAVIFALFAPAHCDDQCPFAGITPDPINVKLNQQFILTLKSNPTTGYSWQICEIVNKNIVKLLGSKYVPDKNTNLAGAGGKQIWTFKAKAKGQARIFLKYVRSWEKNVKPAEFKAYIVTIK